MDKGNSEVVADRGLLYEQIARVGKALGHGKRLELIDLVAQGERTVESLARAARLNLTTASAHLQTLKQAGLITARREGTRLYYRLAGDDVADLFARIRVVADHHLADVATTAAALLGSQNEAVARDELLTRVADGEVTVIDVRPREEYEAGHIPGAISIPLDELPARLAELPADTDIVAYCRGAYCVMAPDAVRLADTHGRAVRRLTDGMLEWRLAGLPVET
ncbi:metalloregulator ArsR/SmtB family transcription factor [Mycobacterium simiae]|uniref:Metalloregulator ArsR/SmtB family transcription factor n=1 Tax=Mycobacterium simiae TaxID=1784 RepID=A0A5B1BIU7_MYCSI|nr:metalloregulator ArsR/SmtB family transcription factor [Mycobacterium simiae]KAA1248286.1 metalloregulator ArsR/SmtB family transcription factor [Mycobacterium simiae]